MRRPAVSGSLPGLGLAAAGAAVALAVTLIQPAISALLVAILLGMVLTNTAGVPAACAGGLAVASRRLLRLGIVLLGLQLSLRDIAALGPGVIALVVTVVTIGLAGTVLLGAALGVRPAQGLLIAAGFSICGAAAVAAVEGVLTEKEDEDVATAIALVVVFGTAMIAVVPAVGRLVGLGPHEHGVWAGGSIHEVAQVVAAGGIIGGVALQAAVVVKLARVLMLAPVIAVVGVVQRRAARPGSAGETGSRPPLVPLFVAGFLAMVLLRTTGVLPAGLLDGLRLVQVALLAAAMFALGTGVRVAALRAVGGRPVLLGAASTVLVAGVALAGVLALR